MRLLHVWISIVTVFARCQKAAASVGEKRAEAHQKVDTHLELDGFRSAAVTAPQRQN